MLERLLDAIKSSRADYADIRLERSFITSVAWRGRRLEGASTGTDVGGTVRCLNHGHGWGVATFNRLDDLEARLARAHDLSLSVRPPPPIVLTSDRPPKELPGLEARLARAHDLSVSVRPTEPVVLAPAPVREGQVRAVPTDDPRDIPLLEKRRYLEHLNGEMLRFDRRIIDTQSAYRDEVTECWFVNSDGTALHELRPDVTLSALAVARDGGCSSARLSRSVPGEGWTRVRTRRNSSAPPPGAREPARRQAGASGSFPWCSTPAGRCGGPRNRGSPVRGRHTARGPVAAALAAPGRRLGSELLP